MTVALCGLALLGVLGGHFWLATPTDPMAQHTEPWFLHIVSLERLYGGLVTEPHVSAELEEQSHVLALSVSLGVALAGIFIAWLLYVKKKPDPARIARALGEIYHAVASKYWIDELVNATVIRLTIGLALLQKWIDENVVDGIVNGVGILTRTLGFGSAWFDLNVVDGAVNGVGSTTQAFGSVARLFQTGRVQQYVSFAVAGGVLLAAWLILS
jgi:NADH-quinone oxidoreductase subunit L